jgi:hypothetical protein
VEKFLLLIRHRFEGVLTGLPQSLLDSFLVCLTTLVTEKFTVAVPVSCAVRGIRSTWFEISVKDDGNVFWSDCRTPADASVLLEGVSLYALSSLSSSRGAYWKLESRCKLASQVSGINITTVEPVPTKILPFLFTERPVSPRGFDPSLFVSGLVKDRLRKVIRDVPLFSRFSGTLARDTIVNEFERLLAYKGSIVVKPGEAGDYFYYVETGEIGVYFEDFNGALIRSQSTLGDGSYFGEDSVTRFAYCSSSTLVAETNCTLWRVNIGHIRRDVAVSMDANDDFTQTKGSAQLGQGIDSEYTRLKGEISNIIGWVKYCHDHNFSSSSPTSSSASPTSSPLKPGAASSFRPSRAKKAYLSSVIYPSKTNSDSECSVPVIDTSSSENAGGPSGFNSTVVSPARQTSMTDIIHALENSSDDADVFSDNSPRTHSPQRSSDLQRRTPKQSPACSRPVSPRSPRSSVVNVPADSSDDEDCLRAPLSVKGIKIAFKTSKPTSSVMQSLPGQVNGTDRKHSVARRELLLSSRSDDDSESGSSDGSECGAGSPSGLNIIHEVESSPSKLRGNPVVDLSISVPKLYVNVNPLIGVSGQDIEPLSNNHSAASSSEGRRRHRCYSDVNSDDAHPLSDGTVDRFYHGNLDNYFAGQLSDYGSGLSSSERRPTHAGNGCSTVVIEDTNRTSSAPSSDRGERGTVSLSSPDGNVQDELTFLEGKIILDIDVGEGVVIPLEVYKDSNPLELSYRFIQEHSFSARYLEPLAVYIFKTRARLL